MRQNKLISKIKHKNLLNSDWLGGGHPNYPIGQFFSSILASEFSYWSIFTSTWHPNFPIG